MKRIGIYLNFPPHGGGTFQYATSLLEALRAIQSPDYCVVAAHGHPAWIAKLKTTAADIESHSVVPGIRDGLVRRLLGFGLPAFLWRRLVSSIGGMERQLARLNCDLWIFPAQDYLAYTMPGPTIGTIHDLMHRHERDFPEVSAFGLYQRRERHYRNMCTHAAAILVDSHTGKRHVLDAYCVAPETIHVLPYVAPSHIGDPCPPQGFDERYTLPETYLFYPAQFWRHKNHVRLIEALALARQKIPTLSLVLAGSPKNNDIAMKNATRSLSLTDAVTVLGYVPDADMAELYRRSRGLVMPTFFGPTNIPPLEAMATGTPMAISDVYAMREQSEESALYFNPTSVDSIATAMVTLVEDDVVRSCLITNGKARHAQLSQSNFNKQFASIIRKIISP